VREGASGGFEERFEYVVKGSGKAVGAFVSDRVAAGDYVSEKRDVSGTEYALVLTRTPVQISGDVTGVTFADMRAGDLDGSLGWLWERVDGGKY
jgi:hypothetical protein